MDNSKRVLIVNADDFGRSSGVNQGIAMAHEKGIVTSASIMVRRPAAEEAAAYARQHPQLSVGLHVDLGEWVYRDGGWETVEEVTGPVAEEVHRQLADFLTLVGHRPTHLDSHQHVHRQGEAGALVAGVARDLAVPLRAYDHRIRFCGDFYGQTAKGEPLPDAIKVEALVDLLAALPEGATELGCHPGIKTDDDLPYGRERSVEVQTLCDPRVRAALATNGIKLRSFVEVWASFIDAEALKDEIRRLGPGP
jgi:chitin disaccharide deacetylase